MSHNIYFATLLPEGGNQVLPITTCPQGKNFKPTSHNTRKAAQIFSLVKS